MYTCCPLTTQKAPAKPYPMTCYQRWEKQAWRAVCGEICTYGSEKSEWKRSAISRATNLMYHTTSPVAYSTKLNRNICGTGEQGSYEHNPQSFKYRLTHPQRNKRKPSIGRSAAIGTEVRCMSKVSKPLRWRDQQYGNKKTMLKI